MISIWKPGNRRRRLRKGDSIDDCGRCRKVCAVRRLCAGLHYCLAVCPQGAVVCNGVTPEECAGIGPLPGAAELFNLLRQRRSIRQYRPENLEPEIIDRLRKRLNLPPGYRIGAVMLFGKPDVQYARAAHPRQTVRTSDGVMHVRQSQ